MTTTETHPALSHRCPFCHSDPGQACRTERGRGRETEHLHSRRIAVGLGRTTETRTTAQVDALCCVCGNLRTISVDYRRHQDQNYSPGWQPNNHPKGWRRTQSLKCDECGNRTRHAILREADSKWRYHDEEVQRAALGCESSEWGDQYVEQLRRTYREMPLPRNPKLHHWFDSAEAQQARDRGDTHMTALCGDSDTIPSRREGGSGSNPDSVEPDQVDWETEFEDPETGLWWVDMDCVNCLRVTNERRVRRRRTYMEQLFTWLSQHPEDIEDGDVAELVEHLDRVRKSHK